MSHSALRTRVVKARPETPPSQPWDLNRAILASDLGKSAKLLLLAIVDHARHGRSKCTASTDTLARESGLSGRHVRNLLPGLESDGWIQIERATGSRQSRHTIFVAPREGWAPFVKVHEVGNFKVHEVGNSGACSRKKSRPDEAATSVLVRRAQEKDSRFAPIEQNCNPPVVHPPDDDPAATAAMLARGFWPGSPRKGGAS